MTTESTKEGGRAGAGAIEEKLGASTDGQKTYVLRTKYVEMERPEGLLRKTGRVVEGFLGGMGAGASALWAADHFASSTASETFTVPSGSNALFNLTSGQVFSMDGMQFDVVSENSKSMVIQQVLPNGHLGTTITVALNNPGSEAVLTVHNGVVSAIQYFNQTPAHFIFQNGAGSGSYLTLWGYSNNGADNLGYNTVQYNLVVLQNWVAQALSSFQHQLEFVLTLGAIGAAVGALSALYKLQRRGKKPAEGESFTVVESGGRP